MPCPKQQVISALKGYLNINALTTPIHQSACTKKTQTSSPRLKYSRPQTAYKATSAYPRKKKSRNLLHGQAVHKSQKQDGKNGLETMLSAMIQMCCKQLVSPGPRHCDLLIITYNNTSMHEQYWLDASGPCGGEYRWKTLNHIKHITIPATDRQQPFPCSTL